MERSNRTKSRFAWLRWTGVGLMLMFSHHACIPLQAQTDQRVTKASKERRYDAGPLQRKEFIGRPDRSTGRTAATMTRVMFQYRFRSRRIRAGKVEVRLTSMEAYSIFLPRESWWISSPDPELLDHEQGHFDIAELAARRVQLVFDRMLAKRESISAQARTEAAATELVVKKLEKVMKTINEQSNEENREYDRSTNHGLHRQSQTEHRRVHQLTLAKLEKELAKLNRQPARLKK